MEQNSLEWLIVIVAAFFFGLWVASSKFRYYAKFTYFVVIVAFVTGLWSIPVCLRKPRDVSNFRKITAFWAFMFKCLGMKMEMRNGERLEGDNPYLICVNHQSMLDLITTTKVLPKRCTIIAKKELIYTGLFGVAIWLGGILFVDRLNPEKARKTIQTTVESIKKDKLKVVICPEGTRHLGDDLLPFKKGAFHLAIQGQIPIVPIVVSSYKNFLSNKDKLFESGKVLIQVLPPIPTVGMTSDDVNGLLEQTFTVMQDTYKQISAEVISSEGMVADRMSR